MLSVDRAVVGMMGGRAETARNWFKKGNVGVSSRSGGITSSIGYYLSRYGIGLSSIVHVGGDAVVGTPHQDVVSLFEQDDDTLAVVLFGEIGTTQEEHVADLIAAGRFTKPLIVYIGGAAAKSGTRFSHAGAIVEGDKGTHASKSQRLKAAGAHLVENFDQIPEITRKVLEKL
jgi:succinyl-CoA synthetase alpha subunit